MSIPCYTCRAACCEVKSWDEKGRQPRLRRHEQALDALRESEPSPDTVVGEPITLVKSSYQPTKEELKKDVRLTRGRSITLEDVEHFARGLVKT